MYSIPSIGQTATCTVQCDRLKCYFRYKIHPDNNESDKHAIKICSLYSQKLSVLRSQWWLAASVSTWKEFQPLICSALEVKWSGFISPFSEHPKTIERAPTTELISTASNWQTCNIIAWAGNETILQSGSRDRYWFVHHFTLYIISDLDRIIMFLYLVKLTL